MLLLHAAAAAAAACCLHCPSRRLLCQTAAALQDTNCEACAEPTAQQPPEQEEEVGRIGREQSTSGRSGCLEAQAGSQSHALDLYSCSEHNPALSAPPAGPAQRAPASDRYAQHLASTRRAVPEPGGGGRGTAGLPRRGAGAYSGKRSHPFHAGHAEQCPQIPILTCAARPENVSSL